MIDETKVDENGQGGCLVYKAQDAETRYQGFCSASHRILGEGC